MKIEISLTPSLVARLDAFIRQQPHTSAPEQKYVRESWCEVLISEALVADAVAKARLEAK